VAGHEVRRIREGLKMTQEDFAAMLGVHRVTVARWETGTVRVTEPMAKLIKLLAKTRTRKG
jgi:DNA-binding transcriptional regulator YiaG